MTFDISDYRSSLHALCVKYQVRRLRVFGSATSDEFDLSSSDIDMLVDFNDPPEGMRLSTQFFAFHEELQALFGRHVDLLEFQAIENATLRRTADAEAVTLYAA